MKEIKRRKKERLISNKLGLHARAAAMLVEGVSRFKADIALIKEGHEVDAKSIMGVMTLAAGKGTDITVRADGPDEEAALEKVLELFERKFDEE